MTRPPSPLLFGMKLPGGGLRDGSLSFTIRPANEPRRRSRRHITAPTLFMNSILDPQWATGNTSASPFPIVEVTQISADHSGSAEWPRTPTAQTDRRGPRPHPARCPVEPLALGTALGRQSPGRPDGESR